MSLSLVPQPSMSFEPGALLGRTEPRLWTPPLRELTPETSVGFDQIDFARDVLGRPFDPWQEFAVVHAGELLEDGSPRFRIVLLLVARQQGKTELLAVLPAYWMVVDASPMVLGLSTKLDYAWETWEKTRKLIERAPALDGERAKRWFRLANGEQEMWLRNGSRYKIAASNAEGGRSLTVRNLMFDEFRHTSMASWEAAEPATSAVWDAQIWCTSNAGDDSSTLLNEMREAAIKFIETGEGDSSVCLLEWSAPKDADPTDPVALAQANPNLGRRPRRPDRLLAKAAAAVAAGGEALTKFRTNYLCQHVKVMDPAVDPGAWARCLDAAVAPATTDSRRALCLDVAPDGQHVTLATAVVLADDRVLVGIVGAWDSTDAARKALPGLLRGGKARLLGWFPGGPAAALAADLADRSKPGRANRPAALPPGMTSEEIKGELAAVCMGFAEQVAAINIVHPGDELLNEHVTGAEWLKRGDAKVFSRKEGHADAAYAVAGAVHLARTRPAPVPFRKLVVVEDG